jgi:hypothetical protein
MTDDVTGGTSATHGEDGKYVPNLVGKDNWEGGRRMAIGFKLLGLIRLKIVCLVADFRKYGRENLRSFRG